MSRLRTFIEYQRASDPDFGRLRLATRSTLATLVSAQLAAWLAPVLGPAAVFAAPSLTLLASFGVSDPTPRDQRLTYLWLPVPALLSLALGTWGAAHGGWGLALFVGVIFVSVLLQRLGPRGTALGLMAFNAHFTALFFHVPLAELPGLSGAAVLGLGVAFAARFLVLPDRPHRAARSALRAFPSAVSLLLRAMARALRQHPPAHRAPPVRHWVARINEAALAIEDLLAQTAGPGVRSDLAQRVFELEITAGRVVSGIRDLTSEPELSEPMQAHVRSALLLARAAVQGDAAAAAACQRAMASAVALSSSPRLSLFLGRLSLALEELTASGSLEEVAPQGSSLAASPEPMVVAAPAGLHPNTRLAIQAALASAIALWVGRWISEDRWFWAVLTAYLVIAPASTRGEIMVRAWRRSLGTVLGVAVGMGVATLAHGLRGAELVLLFSFVFLGVLSLKVSYTRVVVWFTALLAVLLTLSGQYTPELLFVRLFETLAGAAVGAVTSALVLPSRTRTRMREVAEEFAEALIRSLTLLADAARQGHSPPFGSTRELDRALKLVRVSAEPLRRGRWRVARDTLALLHGAAGLTFYVRQLSSPGALAVGVPTRPVLAQALEALRHNAQLLLEYLRTEKREGALQSPQLRSLQETTAEPAAALAALWIDRLAQNLDQLDRTLVGRKTAD